MNDKGEVTVGAMLLISLLTAILVVSTYDTARHCRLICSLDHPKYQEIRQGYGAGQENAPTGLLGPILATELTKKQPSPGYKPGPGFELVKGGEYGSIVKIR